MNNLCITKKKLYKFKKPKFLINIILNYYIYDLTSLIEGQLSSEISSLF